MCGEAMRQEREFLLNIIISEPYKDFDVLSVQSVQSSVFMFIQQEE